MPGSLQTSLWMGRASKIDTDVRYGYKYRKYTLKVTIHWDTISKKKQTSLWIGKRLADTNTNANTKKIPYIQICTISKKNEPSCEWGERLAKINTHLGACCGQILTSTSKSIYKDKKLIKAPKQMIKQWVACIKENKTNKTCVVCFKQNKQ